MLSRVTEGIETFERVTDEGQAEVGVVGLASSLCRGAHLRGRVDLRDLIDGEVLSVDGARKLGFEWSTDLAETIPVDSIKEGVFLKLSSATHVTKTVLGVADKTTVVLANHWNFNIMPSRLTL